MQDITAWFIYNYKLGKWSHHCSKLLNASFDYRVCLYSRLVAWIENRQVICRLLPKVLFVRDR